MSMANKEHTMTRTAIALIIMATGALADGPADNNPDSVRRIPPPGAKIADADRAALKTGLTELESAIAELRKTLKPGHLDLLPDVEIFHKAVRYAVEYDELYVEKSRDDVKTAKSLLKQGLERARQLQAGQPTWTDQTGLVVRGYRSKIDSSVQPYGVVVPENWTKKTPYRWRGDLWWHGRGETLTELNFIEQRQRNPGEFAPANSIVIHPYGRFCNANKFAGETDTFEVIEHAIKNYHIDPDRLVARGFSMGGAACWQFATHHPTFWIAAAPGAGFAETPEFLNHFQNEAIKPTWYEERLWRLYNATDYSLNLHNLPTVAYSGEIDKQKQAADVMARELDKDNIELVHIIGPKTAHKYEPAAKIAIAKLIDAHADMGKPSLPYDLKFTTYTLKYRECAWLRVDGLEKHWEKARIDAAIGPGGFTLTTKNVSALTIDINGANAWPGYLDYPATVNLDESQFTFEKRRSDRSFVASYRKQDGNWLPMKPNAIPEGHHKQPGLHGPIDDAFMDRFVIVRPTGTAANAKVAAWVDAELTRAIREWRRVFRGDAIVIDDVKLTDADMANSHIVLWGTPESNMVMKRAIDRLPMNWSAAKLEFGGKSYDPATHVPMLIYPNPLNPKKYVVINSGFTFREYDALNNARQVPKLPDYAIVDVTTPPNARSPGNVVRAGFFGEQWEIQPGDGR
jgi:hypothetical protein